MRTLTRLVAIGSLLVATPAVASSALERIDRAFAEGRLDAPTRAIYGLRAYKAPERLPVEFRPAARETLPRCATPVFRHAWLERDAFSPEQAAEYASFVARPSLASTSFAVNNAIVVHYGGTTTPLFADQVAAFADSAFNVEFTTMGFLPPLPDDANGTTVNNPGPDTDIYLQTGLAYAYTATESTNGATAWDDATAYSVLDPALPNLETYVAHELHHTSQYAYDSKEADVLYEATAVYVEDKVFGASNDYAAFVVDFQAHPERNLSFATYDDSYMYGAGIWLRWLSDTHSVGNANAVRAIWENSKQTTGTNSKNFFQALDADVLPGLGIANVQAMVQEFAGYRWLSGANSDGWDPEAAVWAVAPSIAQFTLSTVAAGNATTNAPQPLGVNYVVVDAAGGVSGDKLTFTLHGAPGVSWGVTKIEIPATGSAQVTPSAIDAGDGVVTIDSLDTNNLSKIVFAVTNLGTAGQAPDQLDGASLHTGPVTPTAFTYDLAYVKENGTGCTCDVAHAPARGFPALGGLGVIAMLLLRRAASRRTVR